MELETINKLYLELSQVATATTAKEQRLQNQLDDVDSVLWPEGDKPTNYEPARYLRLRAIMQLNAKMAANRLVNRQMSDNPAGNEKPTEEGAP